MEMPGTKSEPHHGGHSHHASAPIPQTVEFTIDPKIASTGENFLTQFSNSISLNDDSRNYWFSV